MPDSAPTSGQQGFSRLNPFSRREEHSRLSVNGYRVLTLITWLLTVLTSVFYSLHKPGKREGPHRHRLWKQEDYHPSPFSMNSVITTLYWLVLFILQLIYVGHLYAKNTEYVNAACNVGAHFITHNLFFFGFIMLWVRGYFWIAEALLIINFFNLSLGYFRHPNMPRFIHIPVISGPLAWNFVALYLCGATAVNSNSLPARILANIAIWGVLVYGLFFLVVYKDYTMGFALSVLTTAIGVTQFFMKIIALQWIFAFVIMGVLFVLSVMSAISGWSPFPRGAVVSESQEREPLLRAEDAA